MQYVVKVFNSSEGLDGYDYAVFSIPPADAKKFVSRYKLLTEAHKKDDDIYKIEYWCWAPDFYSYNLYAELTKEQQYALDMHEWVEVEDEDRLKSILDKLRKKYPDDEGGSVDVTRVLISTDGISWVCSAKYVDVHLETGILPISEVRKCARRKN